MPPSMGRGFDTKFLRIGRAVIDTPIATFAQLQQYLGRANRHNDGPSTGVVIMKTAVYPVGEPMAYSGNLEYREGGI